MKTFSELKLIEPLQKALAEIAYASPTPVQAQSLPSILEGRDVIAQAQTGSGKTAAFALGMLNGLDAGAVKLQGLVLCPTRELADQVAKEIRRLAAFIPNVKVLTLTGGVALRPHLASLEHEPHIVVGTPGRLLDIIKRGALPLKSLQMLVIDEADRMLDMGFADAMRDIIKRTPAKRQTLLFSATIPDEIRAISREYQREPLDVTVASDGDGVQIDQVFYEAEPEKKLDVLANLLMQYQPERAVIFCNMRSDVRDVAEDISRRGFPARALHGEMDQRDRDEMLVQFANRSCVILVASDVAARGLDISDLPMVVNFNVANDVDTHTHRIGRTGRAGQSGIALTLVSGREKRRAQQIEEAQGKPLNWQRPLAKAANKVSGEIPQAPFVTLAIDGGKTDKVRPGDILGALTGTAGIPGSEVGKIDIFPTRSYVAVSKAWVDRAAKRLRDGKIKNRKFRIRKLYG